jgi:tetratricopeptide (TPR) repeat protein
LRPKRPPEKNPSREPQKPFSRGRVIVYLALIVGFTAITLYPVLRNGFTNWDDDLMVTKNQKVFNLSSSGVRTIFTAFDVSTYVPLTILSYAVEYRLAGLNPGVFHADNLLLHLLNCLLVFGLVLILSRNFNVALIASLLFGIHPLHVESVAWITERKDVLYSLFFLSGLILYLRYQEVRKIYLYVLTVAACLLSLLAKPMALTFPFILLLLDYLRKRKIDRTGIIEKIPFFSLTLIFVAINLLAQGSLQYPFRRYVQHLFIFGYNLFFYLFRIVLPVNLSALHPYPADLPTVPLPYLACLVFAICLAWVVLRYYRNNRTVMFGALFFLITILPVSQLLPLAGPAIVSERYTYLPSIGLFFILGSVLTGFYERKTHGENRYLAWFVSLAIIAACAIISHQRAYAWKDSFTLWNDVLAKYPNAAVPNNSLGTTYYEAGDYARALPYFEKAIALKSDYADPYHNRGLIYLKKGLLDQAVADLTLAIKYKPNNFSAYNARGVAYFKKQDPGRALADLNEALKIRPNDHEVYNNLGNVYFAQGRLAEAIAAYRRSVKINPGWVEANFNLGSAYYLKGDYQPAIDYLTAAVKINPRYEQGYYNRGSAYYALEQYPEALSDYYRVLELNPENAGAYYNLALAYYFQGDPVRARKNLEISLQKGFKADPDAVARIRSGGKSPAAVK